MEQVKAVENVGPSVFDTPDVKVRFVKLYYCAGGSPRFWKFKYEIQSPPCSGFCHAIVLLGEKRSTILCPYTLESFQVNNKCGELAQAKLVDYPVEKIGALITKSWEQCVKLQFQRDYSIAALALAALGQPVPKFAPVAAADSGDGRRGGKETVEAELKPVNPNSRRGQVATFFATGELQSVHEAMARLDLTRSGVLSHLFCLNRDHGVGYELVRDCARLLIPEGFDLFAYEAPARAEKPERLNDDGTPYEAKKRTAGKPINPEALAPIPEPGKRAAVARLFVNGFYLIEEAMKKLDLTRSAVLSHLFTINQQNGLGYELSSDSKSARLVVPEGHEVFAAKKSRANKEG